MVEGTTSQAKRGVDSTLRLEDCSFDNTEQSSEIIFKPQIKDDNDYGVANKHGYGEQGQSQEDAVPDCRIEELQYEKAKEPVLVKRCADLD